MQSRRFYVYIMTNGPKAAILYVGMTGDIRRRVWQHKNKPVSGFTGRYNLTRLVYFECFVYPDAAICREKEITGWRRSKKLKQDEDYGTPCYCKCITNARAITTMPATMR
jgi:putative endonuclease